MQENDSFICVHYETACFGSKFNYYKIKDLGIEISVSLDNTQGLKM